MKKKSFSTFYKHILTMSDIDSLGVIGETFGTGRDFEGVLIQIGHVGQEPPCPEPCFRILRFTRTERMNTDKKQLHKQLLNSGNILYQIKDRTTLVCKDLDRQVDAKYVLPKIYQLKKEYKDFIDFTDEDFAQNRKNRRTGEQDSAAQRYKDYVARYNQKGWIQYMKKVHKIHPSVEIIPGMHNEAFSQSKNIKKQEAAAQEEKLEDTTKFTLEEIDEEGKVLVKEETEKDGVSETEDVSETEEGEERPYPSQARKSGQRYASISFILDDTPDMEALIFIHAFYSSAEAGSDHIQSELDNLLHPLQVHLVDMYEWIYPVRMLWNDSAMSKEVLDVDETWSNLLLGDTQKDRLSAVKHNRNLKKESQKKKVMDKEAEKQICERLCVTTEELMAILDDPTMGAQPVINACKHEVEADRMEASQKLVSALRERKKK